jgi:hypothetical protein
MPAQDERNAPRAEAPDKRARALVPRPVDVRNLERGVRRTRGLSRAVRFFTISCCAHPHRQMRVRWRERANARE